MFLAPCWIPLAPRHSFQKIFCHSFFTLLVEICISASFGGRIEVNTAVFEVHGSKKQKPRKINRAAAQLRVQQTAATTQLLAQAATTLSYTSSSCSKKRTVLLALHSFPLSKSVPRTNNCQFSATYGVSWDCQAVCGSFLIPIMLTDSIIPQRFTNIHTTGTPPPYSFHEPPSNPTIHSDYMLQTPSTHRVDVCVTSTPVMHTTTAFL